MPSSPSTLIPDRYDATSSQYVLAADVEFQLNVVLHDVGRRLVYVRFLRIMSPAWQAAV